MYKRILICDDTIYSRTMLRNLMEQTGQYIIVEVSDRKGLMEILEASQEKGKDFDYIFLDLEIKRDNGIEILEALREVEPLVEVILCGGVSLTDETIVKGMELGVKRFLPKPYKLENIKMILKNEEGE